MTSKETHLPDCIDLRDWAHETLKLPSDLTTPGMRVAILERLAQCDFVPPQDWNDSINVLIPSAPVTDHSAIPNGYYQDRETVVRSKFEQFARNFFELPPDQRRAQWEQLKILSAPWPPIRVCMTRLEPALDIDLSCLQEGSPKTWQIGRYFSRRFVQWAAHLPTESWEQQLVATENKDSLRRTAKAFRRRFPHLAEIFAPWIDEICRRDVACKKTPPMPLDEYSPASSRFVEVVLRMVCVSSVIFCGLSYLDLMLNGPRTAGRNAVSEPTPEESLERMKLTQRLDDMHRKKGRASWESPDEAK
ncbi:MAG: hypothetical protein JWM11_4375 [Planctomycetaceae bacterium]|nr:hypothetical protein [Planctomycetaceae bacterium]